MTGFAVVDASLAVKWLVNEIHTEKAFALANFWLRTGIQPIAPYLMPVEVANALYRRVVRGDIPSETAILLLDGLLAAGIELRETASLHPRAIRLALSLRQDAVYDAHYLALAESFECELWTADERFFRVAGPTFQVRWLGSFV